MTSEYIMRVELQEKFDGNQPQHLQISKDLSLDWLVSVK